MVRRAAVLLAAALLGACDAGAPPKPSQDPPPRPAAASASPSASAAPASPPSPASASAAASGLDGIAGTWEATYDAKKGTLGLAPKVKGKEIGADDGKTAVGAGKIEVTVTPGGDVRGKGSGALGACTLTGRVEGGVLRSTILPDDLRAPNAMTGVLIGLVKGDTIHAEIHVAGPDGTMVREAQADLKKKP